MLALTILAKEIYLPPTDFCTNWNNIWGTKFYLVYLKGLKFYEDCGNFWRLKKKQTAVKLIF